MPTPVPRAVDYAALSAGWGALMGALLIAAPAQAASNVRFYRL